MKKLLKKLLYIIAALAIIYLLLLIPDAAEKDPFISSDKKPFAWNSDGRWQQMESLFKEARKMNTEKLDSVIALHKQIAEKDLLLIKEKNHTPADSIWTNTQNNFFVLASLIAVRQNELNWFIGFYNQVRNEVKLQSQQWDMNAVAARDQVYTMLYGMRAAVEEAMLQTESVKYSSAMQVKDEKSATPSAKIFDIEVHSGDLLVSRGGAEVSALIARGNDYAGNFSHIALIYVDEETKQPYLIEAHIEKGVAIASVAQYENDKKLRFMVIRPRADLPAMIADSMLPQKAARFMFEAANRKHFPYDFKMNFNDTTEMFCSEVASYAYLQKGIQLWKYPSSISSPGVVNWLHSFGVENFVTQMPADLEYDPQLSVVAEWRDPLTLYKDHIDNAVMDALLEKANAGEKIDYNIWQLPVVRIVKGYCMIKNLFGKVGMIPEGMSATRALKNQNFVAMYLRVKDKTIQLAEAFSKESGYRPPYWQLVKFAVAASANK